MMTITIAGVSPQSPRRPIQGSVMPTKFDDYIREIEEKIKAEGPAAVARWEASILTSPWPTRSANCVRSAT